MKEKNIELELNGKKYNLVFNLNVMQEIQEKYGSFSKWGELTESKKAGEPNVSALLDGLLIMLNEGIECKNDSQNLSEPLLTQKQVGRMLTASSMKLLMDKVKEAVVASTDTGSEEQKNV